MCGCAVGSSAFKTHRRPKLSSSPEVPRIGHRCYNMTAMTMMMPLAVPLQLISGHENAHCLPTTAMTMTARTAATVVSTARSSASLRNLRSGSGRSRRNSRIKEDKDKEEQRRLQDERDKPARTEVRVARPLAELQSLGLLLTAKRNASNSAVWRSRGLISLLGTALWLEWTTTARDSQTVPSASGTHQTR